MNRCLRFILQIANFGTGVRLRMPHNASTRQSRPAPVGRGLFVSTGAAILCISCGQPEESEKIFAEIPGTPDRDTSADVFRFSFDRQVDGLAVEPSEMKNRIVFVLNTDTAQIVDATLNDSARMVGVSLVMSNRDPVGGLLGARPEFPNTYWSGFKHTEEVRFGLEVRENCIANIPGLPPEVLYILGTRNPAFFIHCRPNGNPSPDSCTLYLQGIIGLSPRDGSELLAEATFTEEVVPRWESIVEAISHIVRARGEWKSSDQAGGHYRDMQRDATEPTLAAEN